MLAEKKDPELLEASLIKEGNDCVKELVEIYARADVTPELVTRIAFEAFVRGRVQSQSSDAKKELELTLR